MIWIYLVILCLFFKARSCQLQRVQETPNDTEFSINVTTHVKAESGKCIWIPFQFTFPTNKVTVPLTMTSFKGDPQNTESFKHYYYDIGYEMKGALTINGLPRGEYEYGFKLEWGDNQTYIFPKRVWISVSALTGRPVVSASTLTEGQSTTLTCNADPLCIKTPKLRWEWTKADGQSTVLYGSPPRMRDFGMRREGISYLYLNPTADHHNTTFTCMADYGDDIVKTLTTVTLTVKFPPRILNGQCTVEGKLVVCVCISRGNPLPQITWPLASLTDSLVSNCISSQTVNSTITMPAADYNRTKCIISNELDRTEIEIQHQNYTKNSRQNYLSDGRQTSDAALPWILSGVSFSLNLILLTSLICTYKQGKRTQETVCEETNTYASLSKADVEPEYSVISPQPR